MVINEKLSKIIFQEFDDSIKGTDIYNHDGSMWLIFTEERKWVVEFTKSKTLWYNYKHFNDILILFGMELSEGAEYIKKWYEDKFIFNQVVKKIDDSKKERTFFVEDTIDNGVNYSSWTNVSYDNKVKTTIDNGVKNTEWSGNEPTRIVDTIQNGVKNIHCDHNQTLYSIEYTIQNGVKDTRPSIRIREKRVEDATQNGVKHMTSGEFISEDIIEDAIQNGVKHAQFDNDYTKEYVGDIIQNGVKDVQEIYENTLNSGLFEINCKKAIKKGVKYVFEGKMQAYLVNDVIEDGVKEVEYYDGDAEVLVNDAIENGVKHIDYSILGSVYQKDHNVTTLDFTSKLEDTIKNGVKEISSVDCEYPRTIINVISNGVKYMMSGSEFKNKQVEDIIKYSKKL
jgi:hypothetical protein